MKIFWARIIGSLSSDVFERRTSTGSKPFSLLISLDATVFLLPSVLILIETICPKICSKSWLKSAKRPLPVDVRRSKTSLLKLPSICMVNLLGTPRVIVFFCFYYYMIDLVWLFQKRSFVLSSEHEKQNVATISTLLDQFKLKRK